MGRLISVLLILSSAVAQAKSNWPAPHAIVVCTQETASGLVKEIAISMHQKNYLKNDGEIFNHDLSLREAILNSSCIKVTAVFLFSNRADFQQRKGYKTLDQFEIAKLQPQ